MPLPEGFQLENTQDAQRLTVPEGFVLESAAPAPSGMAPESSDGWLTRAVKQIPAVVAGIARSGYDMGKEIVTHPIDTAVDVGHGMQSVARRAPDTFKQIGAGVWQAMNEAPEYDPSATDAEGYNPTAGFFNRDGVTLAESNREAAQKAAAFGREVTENIQIDKTAHPRTTKTGTMLENTAESLLQQAPGVALSIAGFPGVGLPMMGIQTFGQKYAENRAAGMSIADATHNSAFQGGVEIGTELMPFVAMAKFMKPGKFSTKVVDYMLSEIPGEHIATALQNSSDAYFDEKDPAKRMAQVKEYLGSHKFTEDQVDTFWTTILQGGIISAAGRSAKGVADHIGGMAPEAGVQPAAAAAPAPVVAQNESYEDITDMPAPKGPLESAAAQAPVVAPVVEPAAAVPERQITEADQVDFENAVAWENNLRTQGRSAVTEMEGETDRDYAWRLLDAYRAAITPTVAAYDGPAVQPDSEQVKGGMESGATDTVPVLQGPAKVDGMEMEVSGMQSGVPGRTGNISEPGGKVDDLSRVRQETSPEAEVSQLRGKTISQAEMDAAVQHLIAETKTRPKMALHAVKWFLEKGNSGMPESFATVLTDYFKANPVKGEEAAPATAAAAAPDYSDVSYLVDGKTPAEIQKAADIARGVGNDERADRILAYAKSKSDLDAAAHEAATSPHNDIPEPSQAQIEAGNYKKGHINLQGLDISIENPAGSLRKGVDDSGKAWETKLAHHYGYIKGTVGKDKDHVDVFIGPNPESDRVFVVDQIDPKTGKLDEHKVMLGFTSEEEARSGYLANYDQSGPGRIGALAATSIGQFHRWLKHGDTKKAFAGSNWAEDAPSPTPAAADESQAETKSESRPEVAAYEKRLKAAFNTLELGKVTDEFHNDDSLTDDEWRYLEGVSLDLEQQLGKKPHVKDGEIDLDELEHVVDFDDLPRKLDAFPEVAKTQQASKLPGADVVLSQADADKIVAGWKQEALRIGAEEDNSKKVVLSFFDRTGHWSKPWKDAGYQVLSYDIQTGDDLMEFFPLNDIMQVREAGLDIVGVLAAPPCTSFAVSGARWWQDQHDKADNDMVEKKYGWQAARYFDTPLEYAKTLVKLSELAIEMADPAWYAMENPVGRFAEQNDLPKAALSFDPANFGNPYTKKTMIWGEFNTVLPTANVAPTQGSLIHTLRGDVPEQKQLRSETPDGFAYAFFMANHKTAAASATANADANADAVAAAPRADGSKSKHRQNLEKLLRNAKTEAGRAKFLKKLEALKQKESAASDAATASANDAATATADAPAQKPAERLPLPAKRDDRGPEGQKAYLAMLDRYDLYQDSPSDRRDFDNFFYSHYYAGWKDYGQPVIELEMHRETGNEAYAAGLADGVKVEAKPDKAKPDKAKPAKKVVFATEEQEMQRFRLYQQLNALKDAPKSKYKTMNDKRFAEKQIKELEKQLKKLPIGMLTAFGVKELSYGRPQSLADLGVLVHWKTGMDFNILHNDTLEEAYADFSEGRGKVFTKEYFDARWHELWPAKAPKDADLETRTRIEARAAGFRYYSTNFAPDHPGAVTWRRPDGKGEVVLRDGEFSVVPGYREPAVPFKTFKEAAEFLDNPAVPPAVSAPMKNRLKLAHENFKARKAAERQGAFSAKRFGNALALLKAKNEARKTKVAEHQARKRVAEAAVFSAMVNHDVIGNLSLQAKSTAEIATFNKEAAEIVAEHIQALIDKAETPQEMLVYSEMLVDGKPVLPESFFTALRKDAAKAFQQNEKEKNRDPEVYRSALASNLVARSIAEGTEEARRYKEGFDHALKGKTKSTLPSDDSRYFDGYKDAQAWIDTAEGKAWYEGKRTAKEKSTGDALKRAWDRQKKDLASIDSEDMKKAWTRLLKATARADHFPIMLAEDATPGAREWLEKFRSKVATFSDFYMWEAVNSATGKYTRPETAFEGRYNSDKGRIRDARNKKIEKNVTPEYYDVLRRDGYLVGKRFETEAEAQALIDSGEDLFKGGTVWPGRVQHTGVNDQHFSLTKAELLEVSKEIAADYQTRVHGLAERFKGVKDLTGIKEVVEGMFNAHPIEKTDEYEANKSLYRDERMDIVRMLPDDDKYSYWTRLARIETVENTKTKRDSLVRPRLDKIIRKGVVNARNGRDISADQLKKTFGFADITIGQYVTAQQAQDHINYTYDALMTLVDLLKNKPKDLSFGGKLHYAIGALGSGKYAAHFQPKQAHPSGGTVPVINVTNTKGDGAFLREFFHAIDFLTTDPRLKQVISSVKSLLVDVPYSAEEVLKDVEGFLDGRRSFTRMPRNSTPKDHALYLLNHYYSRAGKSGRQTDFYREAQKLDAGRGNDPYWSNQYEPFARMAEAWGYDALRDQSAQDDYLVANWAEDGKVTSPQYKGTPYPRGEERGRLVKVFGELIDAMAWGDDGPVLKEGHKWHDTLPYEDAAAPFRKARQDALDNLDKIAANLKARKAEEAAERERKRQEAIWGTVPVEEPAPAPVPPAETVASEDPAVGTSIDELSALFDEVADSMAAEAQEEPKAEAPGTAVERQGWTVEDVKFLRDLVEEGTMVLLASDEFATAHQIPTIHSFSGKATVAHMGYGVFKAKNDTYEVTWTGGGAMSSTPGGHPYTTVSVVDGLFVYPKNEIMATLTGVLEESRKANTKSLLQNGRSGKLQTAAEQTVAPVAPKSNDVAPPLPSLSVEQDKTAAALAKEFAKHGVEGIDEALKGLVGIFGGGPNKLLSFPAGFDEEAYKLAKPHFEASAKAFHKAGMTFKEFVATFFRSIIQSFGVGVKPYAVQFAKDYEATYNELQKEQAAPATQEAVVADNSPAAGLADWVHFNLNKNKAISWQELFSKADQFYGGTQADGTYSVKDAYDAVELGINQALLEKERLGSFPSSAAIAADVMKSLESLLDLVPTQTKRTAEMDEFQQFSTPPHFAWLANWTANLRPEDTYLEPSAGVGGLATFGKLAGVKQVVVNELSARRLALLRLLPFDRFFSENAEQLDNILPDDVKPTVIVMNPPFSSTAGRVEGQRKTINGAKHIEQALARLAPGGRLVAIVGEGMAHNKPNFRDWWKNIEKKYAVRANIGIDGTSYSKYGTTFDNQILVIDKVAPTGAEILTGKVAHPNEAFALLEGIRNDRPTTETAGSGSSVASQQGSGTAVQSGTGNQIAVDAAGDSGSPVVGSGRRGAEVQAGNRPGTADAGRAAGDGKPGSSSTDSVRSGRTGADGHTGGTDQSGNATGNSSNSDNLGDKLGSEVELKADAASELGEINNSVFEQYVPKKVRIEGSVPHNTPLVESAALAAVSGPDPTYTPNLPKEVITKGLLSDAQLESVVYAGQAHQQWLVNGQRRGFFLGDGTGVGKGRQISGIILDNMRQGQKKAVWISKKTPLIEDAKRDFADIGGDPKLIFAQDKTKAAEDIKAEQGIMFAGYALLRGQTSAARDAIKANGRVKISDKRGLSYVRTQQIANWLGADFDGVIVFDEAHEMGNAVPVKGTRGTKKPSDQALAALELQRALPRAKVVYVSATGATEVANLAYADRLGLWGEGTPFTDVHAFVGSLSQSVSAMELVAQNLKQMGLYLARSLSFDGIVYNKIEHDLTDYQRETYDLLATAWQGVLQNINEALQDTGVMDPHTGKSTGKESGKIKSAIMSAFWGSHQRFFNQIITAGAMPSVLEQIEKDLSENKSVVLQLVNTNEADQERALAKMAGQTIKEGEEDSVEELDLTPREQLINFIERAFPVRQMEQYTDGIDEKGNPIIRLRPVLDSAGKPVLNRDAVAKRDQLIERIRGIRIPDSAMQMLINHFGPEKVAEITGRTQRVIYDEKGKMKIEKRGPSAVAADSNNFKDGKKKILIFSQAGGTGFSFHADKRYKNQDQRSHYILQPGWSADRAIQGLGRSHRTNQSSTPIYRLVTTDIPAQKRFISSIARRLEQLGALTSGQRDTAGGSLFSATDNLESIYSTRAVKQFFTNAFGTGQTRTGYDQLPDDLLEQMGLQGIIDPDTGQISEDKIPAVTQFLNRLLSLRLDTQSTVFDLFLAELEQQIEAAKQMGTFDDGMQTVRHVGATINQEEEVYRDELTNASTKYLAIEYKTPLPIYDFDETNTFIQGRRRAGGNAGWFKNKHSGKIAGIYLTTGTRTETDGRIVSVYGVWRTSGNSFETATKIGDLNSKWERIDDVEAARGLWEGENKARPKTATHKLNMVVGGILPIWNRFNNDSIRVVRIGTDDGRRFLGRQIAPVDLAETMRKLNVTSPTAKMTGADLAKEIMNGQRVEMSNGWKFKRVKVSNDTRIEIAPKGYLTRMAEDYMRRAGVLFETIQYQPRYFVPTGEKAGGTIDALMRSLGMNATDIGDANSGSDANFALSEDLLDPAIPGNLSGTSKTTRALANSYIGYLGARLKAAGFDVTFVAHGRVDHPKEVMIKISAKKDGVPDVIINRFIGGTHLHLDEVRSLDEKVHTGILRPLYKAESDIAKRYGLTVSSDLINSNKGNTLEKYREFYPQYQNKEGEYYHVATHEKPATYSFYPGDVLSAAFDNRGLSLSGERLLYQYATDAARGLEEIQRSGRKGSSGVNLKLTDRTSTGIQAAEARAWVSTLPFAQHVNVVQAVDDLPTNARNEITISKVNPSRVQAMELHGTIHVIADNVTDMQRVRALVIGHELAHAGQTDKIVDLAVDWFKRTADKDSEQARNAHATLEQIAGRYGYDLKNAKQYRRAVQEATAAIAEQAATEGWKPAGVLQRIFMYVKHWLRQQGLIKHVSDSELSLAVAEMLRIGEKRLSVGQGGSEAQLAAAWHGSPYDHDGFSSEYIGEGEGHQSYGYGLYFAESKEIADYYREVLSKGNALSMEELENYFQPGRIVPSYAGQDRVVSFNRGDDNHGWSVTVHHVDRNGEKVSGPEGRNRTHFTMPSAKDYEKVTGEKPKLGTLYQVELVPKEDEYLLWDKPLSEQSEKVQAALANIPTEVNMKQTGEQFYTGDEMSWATLKARHLDDTSTDKAASDYLHSLGIRGIKYLNGSSRNNMEQMQSVLQNSLNFYRSARKGGNTEQAERWKERYKEARKKLNDAYNYVIFNDADVEIKAKFALSEEEQQQAIHKISEAATLENLKEILNPLDYSRFRDFAGDRLSHNANTWLADNLGNPFWVKENNPAARPFYDEAKDREVTRMDNNIRMFGGLLDRDGKRIGWDKVKGLFNWSDKITAWGKIRQEQYNNLTDKQKAAYDVIRFEGDAYNKVYATLDNALHNHRIRAAGLDAQTFAFYQAAMAEEAKAFEVKLAIAQENMAEAGMTPEDIEGHIAEYRAKYKDIEGWVHRDHGEGEYQVRVYQDITELDLETDVVQHRDETTDRIRLATFPGVEVSRKIEAIVDRLGGSFKQLRNGAIVVLMPEGRGQQALKEFQEIELLDKEGKPKYKVLVYSRFVASKARARSLAREVRGNYKAAMPRNYRPGGSYETSWSFSAKLNEEDYQVLKTSDMKLELILRNAIDKAKARSEISAADATGVQEALVQSVAEILLGRGAGLYQIRRAQYLIEGYDTSNAVKKYEDYINGTAGLFSKARYALRQFKNMKSAPPTIRAWATKYVSDSLRNMGRADMVSGNARALVSLWYLGFNASWMLVNSTQPYVLGQAELSRYTKGATGKIARAEKDVITGKLTDEEKSLFEEMAVRSQDHDSMMAEMTGMNEGVGGAASKALHGATQVAMALGQRVEVMNRHTMIVAAYRVFRKEQRLDHATALDKALQVNSMVNIDMGRYNLPGWARGPVGRTFYALQSYIQHMLNYLYNRSSSGDRADQKAVLRLLFAMFLIGGLPAGAPGSDELDKLIQQLFGYSPKLALKSWARKQAKEYGTLGEMLEGFVWHGVPGAFKPFGVGVSLTGATQIRLPVISSVIGGDDMFKAVGGPVAGLGVKGIMSFKAAVRGDWGRAVEYMLPTAASNIASGIRQATDGVKTAGGKRVDYKGKQLKMEPHEAVIRAVGLQPVRTADISETRGYEKSLVTEWNDRRKDALDSYRMSRKLKYIQQFNRSLRDSQAQGLVPAISAESLSNVWGRQNKKKGSWEREHGAD